MLYLIEILHQTTTNIPTALWAPRLYLIEILHQTTTYGVDVMRLLCCILSKFYIKPQQMAITNCGVGVVSYRNSTSNHNFSAYKANFEKLYLIEILHQTTTTDPAQDDST